MLGHTIRMTLRFSLSSLHFSLAAAAFHMSVFRPAPVGRSVGKLLWKTLANTIRLSKSKKVYHILFALSTKIAKKCSFICFPYLLVVRILFRLYLGCLPQQTNSLIFVESFNRYRVVLWITCFCFPYWRQIKPYRRALPCKTRAIPHNSKCRYGERGAADAKPKAQIILCVLSSILATQMPCRSCRSGA